MAGEKEYIVTIKKGHDLEQVHDELIRDTSADDSVDSNVIPDRPVEVSMIRENNPRNTHYLLTDNEANNLKNDARVQSVYLKALRPKPSARAFQDGIFDKTTNISGQYKNWGLLRHINTTNLFSTSSSDPGGTYDYVLDGTGVDVVIMDSGIQKDHPEFQDANGASRVQEIDWFTASGVPGTMPANHYTDVDGHGTHVASTVAGKTFGWAKNAAIYSITIFDNPGRALTEEDAFDCILGWHNAKTNGRPTVLNMSWGYALYLDTNRTPNYFTIQGVTDVGYLTGGTYRGTSHSDTTRAALTNKGFTGQNVGSGYFQIPYSEDSIDADVETLINAGIHVCISSGNTSWKHDVSGGVDYNNELRYTLVPAFGGISASELYHRGGTPHIRDNPGFMVGSLDSTANSATLDQKASYSDGGPAVNIYTAGTRIVAAYSNTNSGGTVDNYHENSSFKQARISGTSMASPQVAGMAACLLQAHPTWTPTQVMNWFQNNSQDKIYSTGNNNDYTTTNSLWGGTQRVAYFPLNGQKPFQYTSS